MCAESPAKARLFPAVLTELYQGELIDEDSLTKWFMDPQSKGATSDISENLHPAYDSLRGIGGQLLQQLRAQDSDSEEESDE